MNTFPQAGILMALNAEKAEAIVMIPLFNMETDWCPVCKNLLYQEEVKLEKPVLTADPPSTIDKPPGTPPDTFVAVNATAGTIQKETYGSLKVGDEVLVVFLNGDIHQPVVAGRL
jgi:hypothetical protein